MAMPFEYAYGGRLLCNSRLDQPRMVRGPGPSRKGLELDTGWETRPSGIQTLPSYSADLHLPQRGGPPGTCTIGLRVQVLNASFMTLNFKLVNEYNQPTLDAPDFLLQLQISVFDKDNNYFKEAMLQALKLLNEIYFTLLNLVSFISLLK
jgi:hypothetical protein